MYLSLATVAERLSRWATRDKKQKSTGEYYFDAHLKKVAAYVDSAICIPGIAYHADEHDAAVAVAYLHDMVEDTTVDKELIRTLFGEKVYKCMMALTEDKSLPWEDRKKLTHERTLEVSQMYPLVIGVKIADCLVNLIDTEHSLTKEGETFWAKFNAPKEKQKLLYHELLLVWSATDLGAGNAGPTRSLRL